MLLNRFAHSLVLSWVALTASALAQSTAFTYQGRLSDDGAPADGLHDMQFRLFDALAGGAQVGATACVDNVGVVDGVFTVALDFGGQFAGQERFLEIDVRPDTGLDCSAVTGQWLRDGSTSNELTTEERTSSATCHVQ